MSEKKILVPNIGDFKEVEVIEVLVKKGQEIKKEESIITLESDKSSVEVPSNFEGKIKDIAVKVGDKISEGEVILTVEISSDSPQKEEDIKATKNNEVINFPKKKEIKPTQVAPSDKKGKPASPQTRKFARELGANISNVAGSERLGRVTKEDIVKYVKHKISDERVERPKKLIESEYEYHEFGEVEVKDIPRVKKLSGPHLENSWSNIPHVTQHDEIDIAEMDEFRNSLTNLYTGEKLSITPLAFIMKAMVNAMKVYPNFNSSLDVENGKVIYKKYFHIGVAVDTPHGLMVPKIRNVDKLSIKQIGEELKKVSKQCRDLKIDKKEFFGGSMTVSSLGGIGGSFFTPIINSPEVAILGVGKSYDKIISRNGEITSRKTLPISLSYDHRIIDGAEGARFCVHLSQSLGKSFAFKLAV